MMIFIGIGLFVLLFILLFAFSSFVLSSREDKYVNDYYKNNY